LIIYKIVNTANGKTYIGITTRCLDARWQEHLHNSKTLDYAIYRAMRKYGTSAFLVEVIEETNDIDELLTKESTWIQKFDSMNPLKGYNMIRQDDHLKFFTDEVKIKISETNRRRMAQMSPSEKAALYAKSGISRQGERRAKGAKHVGVHKNGEVDSWVTEISIGNKRFRKSFATEQSAAEAYDKMALYLYGPDAKINFNTMRSAYLSEDLEAFAVLFATPARMGRRSKHGYHFDRLPEETKPIAIKNVQILLEKHGTQNAHTLARLLTDPVYSYGGDIVENPDFLLKWGDE